MSIDWQKFDWLEEMIEPLRPYGAEIFPWVSDVYPVFENGTDYDTVDWSQPWKHPKCLGGKMRWVLRIAGPLPEGHKEIASGRTHWSTGITIHQEDAERNTDEGLRDLIRVQAECAITSALDLIRSG